MKIKKRKMKVKDIEEEMILKSILMNIMNIISEVLSFTLELVIMVIIIASSKMVKKNGLNLMILMLDISIKVI